jgi:hypothetical protein
MAPCLWGVVSLVLDGNNALQANARSDAAGIAENSRWSSAATPPGSRAPPIRGTPAGVQETTWNAHLLPPLRGVECFWGNRVPGVSLRSTPGYDLCSLREQCTPDFSGDR